MELHTKLETLNKSIAEVNAQKAIYLHQYENESDSKKTMALELVVQVEKQLAQLQQQKTILMERTPSPLDFCPTTPAATEAQNNTPIYIPVEVDHLVYGIENYLFFEEVGDIKSCFTVLSTHYAISFNHGHHKDWMASPSQNQTTVIICDQEGHKFETKVVESDAEVDFIVVKSEVPLVHKPPVIEFPRKLERYILLGYPNSDSNYQALEGIFSSIQRDQKGRMRGSSGCRRGYNGGPVFNYKGQLLGINVANDSSIKFTGLTMQNTIGDLIGEVNATFPFLSVIVPAAFVAFRYKDC